MMQAVRTSETSVDNHFTRQYNPEDNSEQICRPLFVFAETNDSLGTLIFVGYVGEKYELGTQLHHTLRADQDSCL
jgi:hypothetical protein